MTQRVDFYFDYVSPYAYIAYRRLAQLHPLAEVRFRPIVLGAALQAHGIVPPVHVASKREYIFRHCQWLASELQVPFSSPDPHPFNSLSLLRLTLVAQCARGVVEECFRFVWREGRTPEDEQAMALLLERIAKRQNVSVAALEAELQMPSIKETLRNETNKAIELGVFGTPTFVFEGKLYFGQDSLPMLISALKHH